MQCQYDTDTSTTVNDYGLLEMKRRDQVTWDVSVYLWALRTCYECQRHRKRHRKSLHEIIYKYHIFLRGDIVDCHPEETLSTEAEPRSTMLFEGWQSTMSPCKECYIYFIIPNVPFLQQISPPWDFAVWHSKLSTGQLTNQIAGN